MEQPINSLDASGEYTIQICHGISLELRPYGAILMNSMTYFQICQKTTKKHINQSPSAAIFELFIEIILPSMQRVKLHMTKKFVKRFFQTFQS